MFKISIQFGQALLINLTKIDIDPDLFPTQAISLHDINSSSLTEIIKSHTLIDITEDTNIGSIRLTDLNYKFIAIKII